MRFLPLLLSLLVFIGACEKEQGPPVVISDVRVLAPMPGSTMGVGYMSIVNRGEETITVDAVSSPQFEKVEMHETTITDGISRMRRLDHVQIQSGATAVFEAGGKHLMLMGATSDTAPGSPVTLEINHNNGLLIVSATMQARLPAE